MGLIPIAPDTSNDSCSDDMKTSTSVSNSIENDTDSVGKSQEDAPLRRKLDFNNLFGHEDPEAADQTAASSNSPRHQSQSPTRPSGRPRSSSCISLSPRR